MLHRAKPHSNPPVLVPRARIVPEIGRCLFNSRVRRPISEGQRSDARRMSKPLLLTIPHRLGKDEAIRRMKSGLGSVRTNFGQVLSVQEESWTGEHLQFRVSALGQVAAGTIEVTETNVH